MEKIKRTIDRFALYDLTNGSFLNGDFKNTQTNNLENAAIFSTDSIEGHLPNPVAQYLQIPLTQDLVDNLPFNLIDTDPGLPMPESFVRSGDREEALKGDFVVLTEHGFYDEKYNSTTQTSQPSIRGFDLAYATLYNQETLQERGTEYIIGSADINTIQPIIIPVSKEQQDMLEKLPAFSLEKEPYGFFMKPMGEPLTLDGNELDGVLDNAAEQLAALEGETFMDVNVDTITIGNDFADALDTFTTAVDDLTAETIAANCTTSVILK